MLGPSFTPLQEGTLNLVERCWEASYGSCSSGFLGWQEAGSLGRAEGGPEGAGTAVPGGLLGTGFFSDA